MRLSDIMGNADLSFYPIVALILFLISFSGIVIYIVARKNRQIFEEAKQLPLADDVLMPRNELASAEALRQGVGHE